MSYPATYYKQVIDAVLQTFDIPVQHVPAWQFIAWRVAIKRMFDNGILIAEMLQALREAGAKRQWPRGVALFHRLEDVVLKNRREQRPTVQVESAFTSIGDVLQRNV